MAIAKRRGVAQRPKIQAGARRPAGLRKVTSGAAAEPKRTGPVFYSVTIYVSRPEGDRADMARHYERNRDVVRFFKDEREMRAHQDAAVREAYGKGSKGSRE